MGTQSGKTVMTGANGIAVSAKASSRKAYATPKLTNFGTVEDITEGLRNLASKTIISTGKHNRAATG